MEPVAEAPRSYLEQKAHATVLTMRSTRSSRRLPAAWHSDLEEGLVPAKPIPQILQNRLQCHQSPHPRPQLPHKFMIMGTSGDNHVCSVLFGKLDGDMPHSSCTCVDQNTLSRLQITEPKQRLPCGQTIFRFHVANQILIQFLSAAAWRGMLVRGCLSPMQYII